MNPKFLATADRIGARLCRDSIWWGGRCNWIGEYDGGMGVVVQEALGPDVYQGTSGIALALFHLAAATGETVVRKTADAALAHALSKVDAMRARGRIGFYGGLAGICHAASRAAAITREDLYTRESLRLAKMLRGASGDIDIIGGCAGAIAPLLSLYREHGEDFLVQLAIEHGQTLIESANHDDSGWSWSTLPMADRPPVAYAVGAAGIASALLELFHVTGESRFGEAARSGFRYIRSHYVPEEENWRDCRFPAVNGPEGRRKPVLSLTWCHGAAGIGLSHVRAWQLLAEGSCWEGAQTAIRTISRMIPRLGRATNYSLSHGLGGMAELFLCGGAAFQTPEYTELARKIGADGIRQFEEDRVAWPCGGISRAETPDLMLGLAGIAYLYLRLHDPEGTPSILMAYPREPGAPDHFAQSSAQEISQDPWGMEPAAAPLLGGAGAGGA